MNSPLKVTAPPLSVEMAIRKTLEGNLDLHDVHRDPLDLPPDTKTEIAQAVVGACDDMTLTEYLVDYGESEAVLQAVRGIITGQEGATDAFKTALTTNVVEAHRKAIEREMDDMEAARLGSLEDHDYEVWRQRQIDAGLF